MKKSSYAKLIPILLVAVLLLSVYRSVSAKNNMLTQYKENISSARNAVDDGIFVDADTYYTKALEINDSPELRKEIGEYYIKTGQMQKALECADVMVDKYPKIALSYDFSLSAYFQGEDYNKCFELLSRADKLHVSSDTINKIKQTIEYYYYTVGTYSDVQPFSSDVAAVKSDEEYWGYIDAHGRTALGYQYQQAGCFSDDVAPIMDKDGECYFIDKSGNKKINPKGFENISSLGLSFSGIFSVCSEDKYYFTNSDGQKIAGPFDDVSVMNGIAAVKNGEEWQLVDSNGKAISNEKYQDVAMDEKGVMNRNNRIFVMQNMKYHMIDSTEKKISDATYDDVRPFGFQDQYASVKSGDKWGFVNSDGKTVIEPQYEDARSFVNGYAAVENGGKWGFIDMDGKLVIDYTFEDARDFTSSGTCFVMKDGVWTMLILYKDNYS